MTTPLDFPPLCVGSYRSSWIGKPPPSYDQLWTKQKVGDVGKKVPGDVTLPTKLVKVESRTPSHHAYVTAVGPGAGPVQSGDSARIPRPAGYRYWSMLRDGRSGWLGEGGFHPHANTTYTTNLRCHSVTRASR
ncbi:hypothetical protein CMUS01_13454 [Colletotrichum musicola]|uniref:Uncharacterized protein n=1 Tax=Colletotrichum musicola TaxID=2175873 RepID=A0A8H6MW76_9PEZI|nr:hypothetical protein CMUS01_13454 [Colletotrichum musicola]